MIVAAQKMVVEGEVGLRWRRSGRWVRRDGFEPVSEPVRERAEPAAGDSETPAVPWTALNKRLFVQQRERVLLGGGDPDRLRPDQRATAGPAPDQRERALVAPDEKRRGIGRQRPRQGHTDNLCFNAHRLTVARPDDSLV